ncbi:MAG: universal stress protein [Bacteroidetes bacterium]|nr:universal stress protein [Bacteroidota bacterium]
MKKILLPTDGSDLGDYAYVIAHKIANATGASIEAFSVVEAPANAFYDPDGNIKDDEGEDLTEFQKQSKDLDDKLQRWIADKPDINTVKTKIGRVNEDIVKEAEAGDFDLIVMGTAGAYGVEQVLRNSHAAHVVRSSKIPVLTLKCDRSEWMINDILLVSDFDEKGELNLKMVKDIQKTFGARLHLLKINTPKHFKTNLEVEKDIADFIEANDLENVEWHIYSDRTIEQGVINFSAESGIDFVAIACHQYTGLSRLFKHDISEDLVNHLWQPVMTFPV